MMRLEAHSTGNIICKWQLLGPWCKPHHRISGRCCTSRNDVAWCHLLGFLPINTSRDPYSGSSLTISRLTARNPKPKSHTALSQAHSRNTHWFPIIINCHCFPFALPEDSLPEIVLRCRSPDRLCAIISLLVSQMPSNHAVKSTERTRPATFRWG